jgi:hypothetical protein
VLYSGGLAERCAKVDQAPILIESLEIMIAVFQRCGKYSV